MIEDDIKTLLAVTKLVRNTLEWLTRRGIADPAFRRRGALVWHEVARRLDVVQEEISEIKSVNSRLWVELEAVGLTGEVLALKLGVLQRTVAPMRRPAQTGRPRQHRVTPRGLMKRLLQWMNSFLGSLGKALEKSPEGAVLDFVKEYKEMTEVVIEHQKALPTPSSRIFEGI